MGRYDRDGGQIPTTLFEAAAFHRSINARCPSCGREAVFHGAALWWLFQRNQWPSHLSDVPPRLRCIGCNRRGMPIRVGREAPTVLNLPMPGDHEWKKAVSRFRS